MAIEYSKLLKNCPDSLLVTRFVTYCIFSVVLLSGCTSPDIYHDTDFNPPVYFGTHVVREGETLYAIALRYGRDFRALGKANGIAPPYILQPGQEINLELRAGGANGHGGRSSRENGDVENVTERKASVASRKTVTKRKKAKKFKDISWQWPHLGPILARYNSGASQSSGNDVNKGIDIQGQLGDPIRASAAGEVVYAGSGLLGYGNLVIINHNALYLSAYAHNRKILVQEGQQIKSGQVIAEMGSSGVDNPVLHFEIRKNGNPVNPLSYLPAR